ncbi:hypothetical protein M885DRAFT_512024 [Pelagophyceae sp. CCMP2097]|nr:hypothetical protein M885DRAFT_512024 [Pelagophyceae sp. CCMP2097]
MVAGVKGVVALAGGDLIAVSSSTLGEVFILSRKSRKVVRAIPLDKGSKAESLCTIPGTNKLLVADGSGKLCCIDLATEPATVSCVATSDLRLTSVVAFDEETAFVAGAVKGNKNKCSVRRVNLATGAIAEDALLEAPMIRALLAQTDKGRLVVGAIDSADDEGGPPAHTKVMSWSVEGGFSTSTTLCELDCFVHSIAPHPRLGDAYVVLARHGTGGSAFDCPVRVVRFGDRDKAHAGTPLIARAAITDTLPIGHDGLVQRLSHHTVNATMFGMRAGREHALALLNDGTLVTGAVDKTTKGVLQLWSLDVIGHEDSPPASSFRCWPSPRGVSPSHLFRSAPPPTRTASLSRVPKLRSTTTL